MSNIKNNNEINVDILGLLHVVVKGKKVFLAVVGLVTIIAVIYSLVAPEEYSATTILMPPTNNSLSITSLLGMGTSPMAKLGGSLLSPVVGDENVFLAIIGSRTLKMEVIEKFELKKVYKFTKKKKFFIEDVLKAYTKHVFFGVNENSTIQITVVDSSKVRASEMANYIARKLDTIYREMTTETARNQRVFLEDRLAVVKLDLATSENQLNDFQKKNGVIDVEEQARVTIATQANVEAQVMAAKLKLAMAQSVYSEDEPRIRDIKNELVEITKQRDNLMNSRSSKLLIPLSLAPDLGLEFVRLKRTLAIQEILFELLMQQYEKAKFEEAKTTPTIQVLDFAVPAEKRTKPKRRIIVMAAFGFAMIAGVVIVFLLNFVTRIRRENDMDYQKVCALFHDLTTWK